jgi:hypothetical protein
MAVRGFSCRRWLSSSIGTDDVVPNEALRADLYSQQKYVDNERNDPASAAGIPCGNYHHGDPLDDESRVGRGWHPKYGAA